MNQNSTENVPEVLTDEEKRILDFIRKDINMPLKAEDRRRPFGSATKQAIDEIVMEIKPLTNALNFLLESNLAGPEMRQVAKIQNSLMTVIEAAKTAQHNLRQIKTEEPVEVEDQE